MAYMPALSYEAIADGLTVCTSSLHRFGTDAVLLTEFSGYRQKDRVCDFGTGCGIIPMLMQRQAPPQEIYGVDSQRRSGRCVWALPKAQPYSLSCTLSVPT